MGILVQAEGNRVDRILPFQVIMRNIHADGIQNLFGMHLDTTGTPTGESIASAVVQLGRPLTTPHPRVIELVPRQQNTGKPNTGKPATPAKKISSIPLSP